jgi:hypothetical protein
MRTLWYIRLGEIHEQSRKVAAEEYVCAMPCGEAIFLYVTDGAGNDVFGINDVQSFHIETEE